MYPVPFAHCFRGFRWTMLTLNGGSFRLMSCATTQVEGLIDLEQHTKLPGFSVSYVQARTILEAWNRLMRL